MQNELPGLEFGVGEAKASGGGQGDPKGVRGSGVEAVADHDAVTAREGGGIYTPTKTEPLELGC